MQTVDIIGKASSFAYVQAWLDHVNWSKLSHFLTSCSEMLVLLSLGFYETEFSCVLSKIAKWIKSQIFRSHSNMTITGQAFLWTSFNFIASTTSSVAVSPLPKAVSTSIDHRRSWHHVSSVFPLDLYRNFCIYIHMYINKFQGQQSSYCTMFFSHHMQFLQVPMELQIKTWKTAKMEARTTGLLETAFRYAQSVDASPFLSPCCCSSFGLSCTEILAFKRFYLQWLCLQMTGMLADHISCFNSHVIEPFVWKPLFPTNSPFWNRYLWFQCHFLMTPTWWQFIFCFGFWPLSRSRPRFWWRRSNNHLIYLFFFFFPFLL